VIPAPLPVFCGEQVKQAPQKPEQGKAGLSRDEAPCCRYQKHDGVDGVVFEFFQETADNDVRSVVIISLQH
jgi:hypothetical protein